MISNRRRIEDEQRKIRLLNEKFRTIGIDVNALNEQVKTKNVSKIAEKAENERLEREILEIDKKALRYQQNEEAQRKLMQKILSTSYIRPKTACYTQKQKATDFKPFFNESPISSVQRFDGEDPNWKINKKQTQLALKTELDKQIVEKTEQLFALKSNRKKWDELTHQQSLMTRQLDEQETKLTKDFHKALQCENRHFASERLTTKSNESRRERRNEENHILNEISSDFLTESPLQGKSLQGPRRILPDRWKGMNDLERDMVFMELQKQLREKSLEHQRQMSEKHEWNKNIRHDTHSWQLGHRNELRNTKDTLKKLALENQILAQQQKNKMKNINLEARNNVPDEKFFSQFGCSAR